MNPATQFDCITVGDVFVDLVMCGFAALPQLGEEAFARRLRREIGGGAAITACGLSRLGARVSLLAMVRQSDGQCLLERLKDCGVETADIRFHLSEPTGLTVAASTAEDRAFLTYPGANQLWAGKQQPLYRRRVAQTAQGGRRADLHQSASAITRWAIH
jgi:sugar/nucleoside kinase (ribokinase family)